MKIIKSFYAFVVTMGLVSTITACADWGQMDDPAGGQKYPTKQLVATYSFEYGEKVPLFSDIDSANSKKIEAVSDKDLNSNVLHVDSTGYARMANPLNSVQLQNGAAFTMWVKTATDNISGALFSVGYNNADSARFYFTPNAQIVYSKPGQLQSMNLDENDPATYKTGAITPGTWHFLALQVTTTGYQLYVDGNKSVSDEVTNPTSTSFNYATLVKFLNNAPYLYIGKGADSDLCESWYDDIKVYRNQMEAKDWAKPNVGGSDADKKVYVQVGESDYSSAWWTTFTDYFTIPANSTFHTKFINHTSGLNNWNNWNLAVTTDANRGGTGYAEYFVIRADAYGWGNGDYSAANMSADYSDWAAFRKDMEGATVDMTIARTGSTVKVTAVATATSGTVYTETYTQNCGDGTQKIRAFMVCDGSYFQIDPAETFVGTAYASGSNLVGKADCTAAWWTAFSDYYKMSDGDQPLMINFINNNSGSGSNWNNWLLACCTDDARGGSNYKEYFILRSDAYGWGDRYSSGTMEQSFDWSTYVSDMHGANCWLKLSYGSGTVKMEAKQKKTDGTYLPDYTFTCPGVTGPDIRFFLTAELASLDILKVGYFPYYDKIFETK